MASHPNFRTTVHTASGRCRLLELPLELRTEIIHYVLPTCIDHAFVGPCWIKGTTAILRTSKRLHDEAAQLMYSQATFLINVVWDCTTFVCQWLLSPSSTRQKQYAFPDVFGKHYFSCMKRFKVVIDKMDTYFGYSKNHTAGLSLGVREQLVSLGPILKAVPEISRLHLHFHDSVVMSVKDESVLKPIVNLPNVRSTFTSGKLNDEMRQSLRQQ
ncbi:MAG: hypothetical protein Q9186_004824 [Xanthomendoza sp. 1 TL-2023]